MAGTLIANTINTDTGLFSTNNAYQGIAKAWVNFNGNNGSIYKSFNVSSVTYVGTGQYTINFTTAMSDANYAVTTCCGSGGGSASSNAVLMLNDYRIAPTTSAVSLLSSGAGGGTAQNFNYAMAAIFD